MYTHIYRLLYQRFFCECETVLIKYNYIHYSVSLLQINLDFDESFPEKGLNFLKDWHFFFEKVFNLKSKDLGVADDYTKSLIDTLKEVEDKGIYLISLLQ